FDASDPDSIIDAIGSLNALEVNPNRIIVSGADFTSLRKLKDTAGRYLLTPDITAGAVGSLFGIPVSVNNRVEGGTASVGGMSAVAGVRERGPRETIVPGRCGEYAATGI